MEQCRKNARREAIIVDLEALVPQDHLLRRIEKVMDYKSTPQRCRNCPCKTECGANEKGRKVYTTHIWQKYLDIAEQLRNTKRAKRIYTQRKETIESVFADAKEKHAMRYTHHRGLAAVTRWVRLKYAAVNLKKPANWSWNNSSFPILLDYLVLNYNKTPVFT